MEAHETSGWPGGMLAVVLACSVGSVVLISLLLWSRSRSVQREKFQPTHDPTWELARERLLLGTQIGKGAFGLVLQAILSAPTPADGDGCSRDAPQTVAVKQCARRVLSAQDQQAFEDELGILKQLSATPHHNVSFLPL